MSSCHSHHDKPYVNVALLLAVEGDGPLKPVGGVVHGGLLEKLKEEGPFLFWSYGGHIVFAL